MQKTKNDEKHSGAQSATEDVSAGSIAAPSAIARHTEGRWLASNRTICTHNSPDRYWERHVHVADTLEIVATGIGATRDECFANADLIAAAPDMKALLYQYRDDMRHPVTNADNRARRIEAIEAAIAKSEGK